jgi:tetratricopeptide (TPR) repeat protein
MARWVWIGLALSVTACRRDGTSPGPGSTSSALAQEARALIAQGDVDTALSRLQGAPQSDPEVLLLQGLAWAHKAETAPAPPPEPPDSPAGLKSEEVQALSFFERAGTARPDLAQAHLAVADLLAPHVLRRLAHERALQESRARGPKRRDEPAAVPLPEGPDLSVERVLQAYRRAAQADRTGKPVVEAWIDFARKAERLDEADAAFRQLLLRDKERAEPFLRYGDFLSVERKDDPGAIAQYAQALIWDPNLEEARAKIAEIYLAQAAAHFEQKEYASAQARLADAKKYVGSSDTPQAARWRELRARLLQIRGR